MDWGDYAISYALDPYEVVTDPVEWKGQDWVIASSLVLGGSLLILSDEYFAESAQEYSSEWANSTSKYLAEPLGSGLITLPAMAVLSTVGWAANDQQHVYVGLQGIKAYFLAGGATLALKFLFRRERPSEQDVLDPLSFYGPFTPGTDHLSFPSGHTATVFAVATVVAKGYPETPWVGYMSYSLAGLAGLSRVYDGEHWSSDVYFGALLGWYIGHIIMEKPNWQMTAGQVKGQSTIGVVIPF